MSENFVVNKEINTTIADIFKRYSCRKYLDKAVPVEIIRMLVECGRVAPCGGNNQSTTFYVITNPDVLKGIGYPAMERVKERTITGNPVVELF